MNITNNGVEPQNQAQLGSKEEQDILDNFPRIDATQKAMIFNSFKKRLEKRQSQ